VLRGVDKHGNIFGWFRDENNQDHGFMAIRMPYTVEPPIYGNPRYIPYLDKNFFIWKNRGTGNWHVIATAGGEQIRYQGTITTSQPINNLIEKNLESSDSVSIVTPNQIAFDMGVSRRFRDGFSFRVPVGATVKLELNDNTVDAQELVKIGGYQWRANELPIVLND
jgi:hypothetical protein